MSKIRLEIYQLDKDKFEVIGTNTLSGKEYSAIIDSTNSEHLELVEKVYNNTNAIKVHERKLITLVKRLSGKSKIPATREVVDIENSSRIVQVTYVSNMNRDLPNKLIVKFKRSGLRYEYHGVPYEIFQSLISAESVGKAFNELILNKYEYSKIDLKV